MCNFIESGGAALAPQDKQSILLNRQEQQMHYHKPVNDLSVLDSCWAACNLLQLGISSYV